MAGLRLSRDSKAIRGLFADGKLRVSAYDMLALSKRCPVPVSQDVRSVVHRLRRATAEMKR